jgi:omega-hydroxy-beta-dihydromenaquinone-9 sulfotransferase
MAFNRFLFVVGTGRCGSTLLARILAAHPEVGWISSLPPRAHRIGRVLRMAPRPAEAYELLQTHVSPMLVDPFRDLTADDAAPWLERRLRRFFEEHARREGRPVFMHKFTGWPRARLLAAVFPEAKFVHVVRDGRAVANSLLQIRWWRGYRGIPAWSFGDLSEEERRQWEETKYSWAHLAGLEWKRLMAAFEAARSEIDEERWLDVRYEDLVARPKEETTRILRFVGLATWEGLDGELTRLGVSEGRADAYRDELRPEDVALLDSQLASTLERWGYTTQPGEQPPAA